MELYHRRSKYWVEGNTFIGFFDIPYETLQRLDLAQHETGKPFTDYYLELIYIYDTWDERYLFYDRDQFNSELDKLSLMRERKLITTEFRLGVLSKLRKGLSSYNSWRESINNKPRRIADAYLKSSEVRNEVFKILGRSCLCCGTDENITIDHIVPVSKEGKNQIDNLQPLCKSCNSRKGVKIIDYRNNGEG